uniref:matrix Gla protein n=1 Tax=Halichoerus grypus TaxID=9711 RepID=UPI00165934EA|nr:matrix Gla protein [Halichoerus grypus]
MPEICNNHTAHYILHIFLTLFSPSFPKFRPLPCVINNNQMNLFFIPESYESMESYEINPFINRRNANTFIYPQLRWRAKAQERIRESIKPAYEINREACDDFKLCERYAMVYGYNAAYNRYFRQRRGAK